MTRASRVFPMLSVADIGRSLGFYEAVLGGRRGYQFPEEGPPAFLTLSFGETGLGLGAVGKPLHGQVQRPASGHRIELCIYVDDVDEAHAALTSAGAKSVLAPCEQPGESVSPMSRIPTGISSC